MSGNFTLSREPDVAECKANTRQPDNTAFKQQRLPAWQPILTARSTLPAIFLMAALFIPIGIVLVVASNDIIEFSHDYTYCTSSTGSSCADLRLDTTTMAEKCICTFQFEVTENMMGEVFVYYGLTNFFQNHRRYVKSRDDVQLNGQPVTAKTINEDCDPFGSVNGSYYAPAGAIANSLFNDTFDMTDSLSFPYDINRTDIAWPTDSKKKFNNPKSFAYSTRPRYWQVNVSSLDPDNPSNNGYENEGLIVWMRTAAFPTFRKPYGRISNGVPKGIYNITVAYNFPVVSYDGTKRFILSTTSWIGGKNLFLGVAYIVVGSMCFATAVALYVVHNKTKNRYSHGSPN